MKIVSPILERSELFVRLTELESSSWLSSLNMLIMMRQDMIEKKPRFYIKIDKLEALKYPRRYMKQKDSPENVFKLRIVSKTKNVMKTFYEQLPHL